MRSDAQAPPSKIKFHRQTQELELLFGDQSYRLSAEFLRVHSPSAEVRGHGEGEAVLQFGKQRVTIDKLEPCGNYALKLVFSDGHDSGLYSWGYLKELCSNQAELWQSYLEKLHQAGLSRDPELQVIKLIT
ncbi:DUF971 domain-containing protein [Halioxenophilus sp. WMMB6]|uniref:DUF971 domain-containing protein n=1 Tax=Halioxenophilus sp. WMMB6 TaxID=3073815 RepID=UPI00295EAA33|nr:DUF971 domain-containing protein [Halioxenophilus sp. WMMB6]